MKSPLVSITIPTYNSGKTLDTCLKALKKQTYKNIEINIIDGESSDNTIKIAKKYGVEKLRIVKGFLLQARYEGIKLCKGKYIVIFDSDQILEKDAIFRAVKMAQEGRYKMLALEENVFKRKTLLEKLFDCDRKLINKVNDLSPYTGVIMPRFFEANLIKRAYTSVPEKMLSSVGGQDHAIIYYEAYRLSNKVGVVPNAVKHMEPSLLIPFMKKFYRWGYTSVDVHFGKYSKLRRRKERLRTGLFTQGLIIESLGSVILLFLKWFPARLGYYKALFDRKMNK